MKPAPFDFYRAVSVDDAVAALADGVSRGLDAKVIAGGQSLVAMMNMRLARPQLLVDLNGVEELAFIEHDQAGLRVGAMTRQRTVELSDKVRRGWPLLSEALALVAHTPIRNRGTLGGSLAHADPAAELCAVGLALDAMLILRGAEGERELPVDDFFLGPFTTALEPDEILVEVVFPGVGARSGWAFEEVARRRGDFALAGVAAQIETQPSGEISRVRLAYISLGPTPTRGVAAEQALLGERPDDALFKRAAELAAASLEPFSDIHAGVEYRTHLSRVLTIRALGRAWQRAGHMGVTHG